MSTGDINGNLLTTSKNSEIDKKIVKKYLYVPADVVKEYFDFLPSFIKQDLYNGPISKCENTLCKKPVFDYVIYEYCLGYVFKNITPIKIRKTTTDFVCSIGWCKVKIG